MVKFNNEPHARDFNVHDVWFEHGVNSCGTSCLYTYIIIMLISTSKLYKIIGTGYLFYFLLKKNWRVLVSSLLSIHYYK